MKRLVNVAFIAIIGGFSSLVFNHLIQQQNASEHTQLKVAVPANFVNMPSSGTKMPLDFTIAAEKSVQTVVNVKTSYTYQQINNTNMYDPFRYFFDPKIPQQKESKIASGSGVIVSHDGYIITNNHVVQQAEKIEVTLNDKRSYIAELIGADPTTDLALLKIKETNLPFMAYGNSDKVKIGEWVLAVGNPFNLTSTVTAGIVSAKARNINILENNPAKGLHPIESFIQTDAAVNPGNSGGALVNTDGELIGINSAIASNTGSYAGYSFAIPVNIARKVVADLIEFGEVQRAFIGVSIRDLDANLAKEKKISEIKGVYVDALTIGGSAEEAGVKSGDVILKVGEVNVNNVPELQEQVSYYRPGDIINITVKRNEQLKIIKLILKNKNGDVSVIEKTKAEAITSLGAFFEPASKAELKKLNIENGLKIKQLQAGKLLSVGVQEGFIITSIDKKKIISAKDIEAVLVNKRGGVLIEGVYPNGMKAYYGFGI
jgi:Do/DeqQ family serine protease